MTSEMTKVSFTTMFPDTGIILYTASDEIGTVTVLHIVVILRRTGALSRGR